MYEAAKFQAQTQPGPHSPSTLNNTAPVPEKGAEAAAAD
jgi:hypothetical protein